MKLKKNTIILLISIFILGLIISCGQAEDEAALDKQLVDRTPDSQNGLLLSEQLIQKLELDLKSAGYQDQQINLIKAGIKDELKALKLKESTDVLILAPVIIRSALISIKNPNSQLKTSLERIQTIEIINQSIVSSLKNILTEDTSQTQPIDATTDSTNDLGGIQNKHKIAILDHPKTSKKLFKKKANNLHANVLKAISETSIGTMDDAGVETDYLIEATGRITKSISSSYSKAGVKTTDLNQVAEYTTQGAIGAIDDAGITEAGLFEASNAIITNVVSGIADAGYETASVKQSAQGIVKGAIMGLKDAGIVGGEIDNYSDKIIQSTTESLSQIGVDDVEIAQLVPGLTEAVIDGKSESYGNNRPFIEDLVLSVNEDSSNKILITAVDEDGDPLTFRIVKQPGFGTLNQSLPEITYEPSADFNGEDTIQIVANDGLFDSRTAVYTINVLPVNDAPTVMDLNLEMDEDTSQDVGFSGFDVEENLLTFEVVDSPQHGVLSGESPNLVYTPNENFNGTDSFTYKANDGSSDSEIGTVEVTIYAINDAPGAINTTVTTTEDNQVSILLNASDPEQDELQYEILTAPASGTLSGVAPNLTYSPDSNYNGTDSFTFSVKDPQDSSSTATVNINITAVNDAPIGTPSELTTDEDTSLEVNLSAVDPENDPVNYSITSYPANGTVSGTPPKLVYQPNKNFFGTDSLLFKASDGTLEGHEKEVTITVTAKNDTPKGSALNVFTNEDVSAPINLSGTDPENDPLEFIIASNPLHGQLQGTPPSLTYIPNANYNGVDSFTYTVNDGLVDSTETTVTISVAAQNDPPNGQSAEIDATEDASIPILLSGSDLDGDLLTFTLLSMPKSGNLVGTPPNLTYNPNANFNGDDSFTFKVSDGFEESAVETIMLNVLPQNDAPSGTAQNISTNEDTSKAISLAGADIDGDSLTFTVISQPSKGTLSGTAPELTFTPNPNVNGTDSLTFKVNDGNLDSPETTITIDITPINDAPVALGSSISLAEDTPTSVNISGSDVEGSALTYTVVNQPTNGTLTGTAPNLTFTPHTNYNGTDSFTFKVNDGSLDSSTATVSFTVNGVNDAPVGTTATLSTDEDTASVITLAATDVDNDPLTYTVVTQPIKGTLSGTAPNLTYTPNANANGADSFTFRANDGTLDSTATTVSLTIHAVNDAPVSDSVEVTTNEDVAASVTLSGSDIEGDLLTYQVLTPPTKGSLNGMGANLTYTPNSNANGTDSFTYKVNDGALDSTSSTVTVTITPVNDTPTSSPGSITTNEDTSTAVTLSGSDIDENELTFHVVTQPTKGSLSGTAPNLTYTPNANANGADSFTFKVNDGTVDSGISSISLTINAVNDTPTSTAGSVTTNEDVAASVTLSGTDIDGDPLAYTVVTQPSKGTLSGTAPNLTYTPDANTNGTDSFTFKVDDGLLESGTSTVFLSVAAVNDAPSCNTINPTTNEDTAIGVNLSCTDTENDPLTYSTTSPSNGTLSGTAPNLTYTPNDNFNGTDSFTYTANDGTDNSASKGVSITINAVNDAPVALGSSISLAEDTPTSVNISGSDVEGSALTYTVVNQPTNGTLTGTAPNLIFTPHTNYNGTDSFTFKVNDGSLDSGTSTVSLSINAVNDAPSSSAGSVTTNEDVAASVILSGTDIDGDALTYSIVTQPAKGTLSGTAPNLTYTPNANANGGDSFTFKVSDGALDSGTSTVSLSINAVNDAPSSSAGSVTTNEDVAASVTLSGTDIDGDALTYSIVTQPAKGTLSGTAPNLTYTPNANANGSDSFTFKVNDGLVDSGTSTVSLSITAINDAPSCSAISPSTNEDTSIGVTLSCTDAEGDPLSYNMTTPANGILSGTAPNLTYTPNANFNGTDSFTYTANDGTDNSTSKAVSITINAVNDAPVALGSSISLAEDTPTSVNISGTDVEGSALTYTVVNQPTNGTLTGTAPNLTFTPHTNYNGTDSFTFKVNDGSLDSSTATVSFTVNGVNDAPVANSNTATTNEDSSISITLTASDVENNTLSYSIVNSPLHGTLTGTAPNLTYLPSSNYNGSDNFSFKVDDGQGVNNLSQEATISLTIQAVNDTPVANTINRNVVESTEKSITLTGSDVDGDPLIFSIATSPAHGSLGGTPPNVIYYPSIGYTGNDSFMFEVSDGTLSSVADVNLSVNTSPGFIVSAVSGNTGEDGTQATFTVKLKTQPSDSVTIPVSSDNPEEGQVDKTQLIFDSVNWAGLQTVTITGQDDFLDDGTQTYSIVLSSASSLDASYDTLNPVDIGLTNIDNDTSGFWVSAISGDTMEDGTQATFTVKLTSQPTANVTLDLTSSDLTEGTVSPASLTFTPENWNGLQTVTVSGVNDFAMDTDQTFSILLDNVTSGDSNYNGYTITNPVTVTNVDDDMAGFVIGSTSLTTSENGTQATFTFKLTSQPSGEVVIGLSSSDLTEGTVSPASLTFNGSNWNGTQTVTVTGVDDFVQDGNIPFSITTAAASSVDGNYNNLNPSDINVVNNDDDIAGFIVSAISRNTIEDGTQATFTVKLQSEPIGDVVFNVTSSDTTEGIVDKSTLTFTPANWNGLQTVTVSGQSDWSIDGNIGYSIILGAVSSNDPNYDTLDPSDVSVINTDIDTAQFVISKTTVNTAENGTQDTFTVKLASQPVADVVLVLSSSDTSEATVSPSSLTFTSGNWAGIQTVTVTGVDDSLDDGNISYSVITAAVTSSDPNYDTVDPTDISGSNVDNDTWGFTFGTITGSTTEALGQATFTVKLNSQPTENVTFSLTSSDETEGTVSPSSLTFTPTNWNGLQTVVVTGVNDFIIDGNIDYSVQTGVVTSNDSNYDGQNPSDVSVVNTDNDTAGFILSTTNITTNEDGTQGTFTVKLQSQPATDVVINLSSQNGFEGLVSPLSMTFTPTNWNGLQTTTVTGLDDWYDDGDISYLVQLGAATSGDPDYSGLDPQDVTVTNIDNDTSGFLISSASGNTGEDGTQATFTIKLKSKPYNDVILGLSSNNVLEGTITPTSLTFTPNNWNANQIVTVTGVNDWYADGNQTYSIATGPVESLDADYNLMDPADVGIVNIDDDTAGFVIGSISGNTGEDGTQATFTIRLQSKPYYDVLIDFTSSNTMEGTVPGDLFTFTSSNWNIDQIIPVTGVDDWKDDGNQPYSILINAASSSDSAYNGYDPADLTVVNIDNDTAGIIIGPVSGNTTEAGGTATIPIRLQSQPGSNVNLDFSSSDTGEGTISNSSFTFTTTNWNVDQNLVVTGVDDWIVDGNQSLLVVTDAATSTDGTYNGIDPQDITVINEDNDSAGVSTTLLSSETSESFGQSVILVKLNSQPSSSVTFTVSPNDYSEATTDVTSLTFTSSNWNTEQMVIVIGQDDLLVDGDKSYIIELGVISSTDANYSGLDPLDLSLVNIDNEFKIPDTGQTNSLTTSFGEDHDYIDNPPSFVDNGDGTITDNNTGIMWQQNDSSVTYSWSNAFLYCKNLVLASYSDWRLPKIDELHYIVDNGAYLPAINTLIFSNSVSSGEFWSKTDLPNYSWALSVRFDYGTTLETPQSYGAYVRCVR